MSNIFCSNKIVNLSILYKPYAPLIHQRGYDIKTKVYKHTVDQTNVNVNRWINKQMEG